MNNTRRKELKKIIARIENIRTLVEGVESSIEAVMEEEQDCFDCMPENLQGSDRGMVMEECIDYLDNAISWIDDLDFDDLIDNLQDCIDA